jgi:hypothetical protein
MASLALAACDQPAMEGPAAQDDAALTAPAAEAPAGAPFERQTGAGVARAVLPEGADALDPALRGLLVARATADFDGFLANAAAEQESLVGSDYPFRPHRLEITWREVGPVNGRLRSFLGSVFSYQGGAHPNHDVLVVNWDAATGAEVELPALFAGGPPPVAFLQPRLAEGLVRIKTERGTLLAEGSAEWIEEGLSRGLESFERFTFEPGGDGRARGLRFYFPPYFVGSYAEGMYEAVVPAHELAPVLAGPYREAFDLTAPSERLSD